MADTFLPNENIVWNLTSNCTISKNGEIGFMVRVLWRKQISERKGTRKSSTVFKTITEAEDNAFEFRYSLKDKATRLRLDKYKMDLDLRFSNVSYVTESMSSPMEPPAKRIRQPSSGTTKKYAMSGSHALNKIVQKCSNPKNSYTALNGIQHLDKMQASAQKIQCYIRNRDIKRSAKNMKAAMTNQTYRLSLIKYLSNFISDNNCVQLLLGADDPEILASYSLYDKVHVTTKAKHITDALLALSEAHQNCECITWVECCETAVTKNYNQINRARTVADWYL